MSENREKYVSIHFSNIHNIDKIEKEYANYFKFFKGNYAKEIPDNRDIAVLDMGCGLGETLYALNRLGYKNIEGIDYSKECVDFCNAKLAVHEKGHALQSKGDFSGGGG